jgi:hypothetical protein
MSMIDIKVRIRGVTPLILNRFHEEAAIAASSGSSSANTTQDRGTPEEIAEKKLYRDLDGKPCMPSPNLLRCIVDGGRFFKEGGKQITTDKKSLLYACLQIEEATIRIVSPSDWKVDTRPIRIPKTGGRILAHRPTFDLWELEWTMTLDTSIVGVSMMRNIVDAAGNRVGLGDFRPATKGPYGRFVVTLWKEIKILLKQAAE